jgi:hypothetical protein
MFVAVIATFPFNAAAAVFHERLSSNPINATAT